MNSKFCSRCNHDKPIELYLKNQRFSDGYAPWCRPCRSAYSRQWTKANPDKYKKSFRKALAQRYGLTPEQLAQMVVSQNDQCKICGKSSAEEGRSLAVDHCHATGRVRGLLCHFCNRMLGWAKDSPDILANAIAYLKEPA